MKRKALLLTSLLVTSLILLDGCNILPFPSSSSSSSEHTSVSTSSINKYTEYVNLVSANDIHGRVVTIDGDNGMDLLAGKINDLEKQYGDFIKIANGDIFQGKFESNILYGRPIVDCLNAMEFDAFVIGNHEFDWGLDKIAAYNDGDLSNGEAEFPFLACNIVYKNNQELLDWVEPYTILENNGYKVGLIGAIGSTLTSSINGNMVKDYEFLDSVSQVKKYAQEIRTKHDVDYVVLAIHDHTEDVLNQIGGFTGDSKINAIFTAHTHQKKNMVVGGNIPVLQGGGNNQSVSVIRLKGTTFTKTILDLNTSTPDSKITTIVDSYVKGEIEEKGNEVIGFNLDYKNAGAMASILANVMKEKFDADVGITNKARTSLDYGDILMKEMYEVFPFDNMIIKATISGKMLKSFVNYSSSMYYNHDFSTYGLVDDQIYTIAIIDYVYDNERNKAFFDSNPEIRVEQNVYMRDLMIDYVREVRTI
ncbi:MAG: bifunctional metallophosphatase/5'-nucleotidase [Bacilli bacterium]|nr:bifunctional metallophosphatase/5'-nucleotidase [Bacilli bacterium]